MRTVLALMNRNRKLFFKDKGMLFTSMITPVILIVLYATFLAKVFRDSFTAAIPDVITISDKLINGTVAAQLTASLMAVSCITVTFCVNLTMVQDKANGTRKDFDVSPISSGTSSKKQSDEVVIEAKGLYHKGTIKPFDIKIHKGEVVGLSGLLGSGRSELVRAIYGADKPDGGELYVKGEKLDVKAPIDAMHKGMAYCPEDRKVEGIIADLSVRENMILALQAKRGMFKLMSRKEQEELTDKYIKMLQVKTASRETPIKSLSGGNQQKVILGRWLMTEPDFLILDEPTRGIDVGTKTEIQKLVVKLANEGMSVVFISSEVEEMLRTVTHMGILRDGEKVGELEESELSQENVMKAIAGGDK